MKSIEVVNVIDGQGKIGVICGENAKIVLPMYYMDDIKKDITQFSNLEKNKLKLMAKAWQKYSKKQSSFSGSTSDGFFNFDVVLSIVNDFIENGIYIELDSFTHISNTGKIDFPSTVKQCKPLLTTQGAVYLDYITHGKRINNNELISNVEVLILNHISKQLGWLIGFNISLPADNIRLTLGKHLIPLLMQVRNNSFNSRKLKLIELFISYIKMTGGKRNDLELPICTAYDFWEDIVFDTMSNTTKKELSKNFYIHHEYVKKNNKSLIRSLDALIPDAVYKDNYSIIILDAKYYSQGRKPNNDDITKQFIYMVKTFHAFEDSYAYRNIFVLPTAQDNLLSDEEIIFDSAVASENEFVALEILYMNFEELLTCYVHDSKMYKYLNY